MLSDFHLVTLHCVLITKVSKSAPGLVVGHVHCNGTAFTIVAMFFLCAYKYEAGLGGDPSLGTSSVLFSSLPPISRTELLNVALLKSLRVDTF